VDVEARVRHLIDQIEAAQTPEDVLAATLQRFDPDDPSSGPPQEVIEVAGERLRSMGIVGVGVDSAQSDHIPERPSPN